MYTLVSPAVGHSAAIRFVITPADGLSASADGLSASAELINRLQDSRASKIQHQNKLHVHQKQECLTETLRPKSLVTECDVNSFKLEVF